MREDGREGDVFSLIGPKRYDAPWKDIEAQGYIAPADCVEVRVTLTEHERLLYATAEPEERYRLAATTETKTKVIEALAARHADDQLLVIGQYLDQLDELGERLGVPVIKGETPVKERERLFEAFRSGEHHDAGGVEGGELLGRPARSFGGDPGVGLVRIAPGRSAAARPAVAAQARRPRRRGSTRSSRATPSTRTTPHTASASWPSRATRTASSTPTTCWPAKRSESFLSPSRVASRRQKFVRRTH